MNKSECIVKVLPNGHLLLPPTIASQLNLEVNSQIRILIIEENKKRGLSRFCGQWQDERDAEDIVSEIYSARHQNNRSETSTL
jgi:hypothetical protein